MISESEVERFVQEPGLLVELCREVVKGLGVGTERQETAAMEIQLREIARTIDKLDKQGVSIPEAFRAEKTRLAAALGTHAEADQVFSRLAEGLEDLLQDIRAHIGRTSQLRKANTTYVDRSRSESSKQVSMYFGSSLLRRCGTSEVPLINEISTRKLKENTPITSCLAILNTFRMGSEFLGRTAATGWPWRCKRRGCSRKWTVREGFGN